MTVFHISEIQSCYCRSQLCGFLWNACCVSYYFSILVYFFFFHSQISEYISGKLRNIFQASPVVEWSSQRTLPVCSSIVIFNLHKTALSFKLQCEGLCKDTFHMQTCNALLFLQLPPITISAYRECCLTLCLKFPGVTVHDHKFG